jgi:hypothetical protein
MVSLCSCCFCACIFYEHCLWSRSGERAGHKGQLSLETWPSPEVLSTFLLIVSFNILTLFTIVIYLQYWYTLDEVFLKQQYIIINSLFPGLFFPCCVYSYNISCEVLGSQFHINCIYIFFYSCVQPDDGLNDIFESNRIKCYVLTGIIVILIGPPIIWSV